jgi:hypothetical protein
MAFFSSTYNESTNFYAVHAGDADEMVSRLQAAVAAALAAGGDHDICDFKLAGAGSGPEWEAWFVEGESDIAVDLENVQFVAAVAGNPTEAVFYLKQRLAAAIGNDTATLYKVEIAGAGDGPTYMAVAVFTTAPPEPPPEQ